MPPKKSDKKKHDANHDKAEKKEVSTRMPLSPPPLIDPPTWVAPAEATTIESLLPEWNAEEIASEDWCLNSTSPFEDGFGVPELPSHMQKKIKHWVRLKDYAEPPLKPENTGEDDNTDAKPKSGKKDRKDKQKKSAANIHNAPARLADRDVDETTGRLLPRVVVPSMFEAGFGGMASAASQGGDDSLSVSLDQSKQHTSRSGGGLPPALSVGNVSVVPMGAFARALARPFRRRNQNSLGFSVGIKDGEKFPEWDTMSDVSINSRCEEVDELNTTLFRTVDLLSTNLVESMVAHAEMLKSPPSNKSSRNPSRTNSIGEASSKPGSVRSTHRKKEEEEPPPPDNPYLWEAIYPQDKAGRPVFNPGGKYCVKLWVAGKWRKVVIDDRIPVDVAFDPLLAHSELRRELWPTLLAKALYKVYHVAGLSRRNPPRMGGRGDSRDVACYMGFCLQALTSWVPNFEPQGPLVSDTLCPRPKTPSKDHMLADLEGGGTPSLDLDLFDLPNPFPEPSEWEVLQRKKARRRIEALYPHKKKQRDKYKEKDIHYTKEQLEEIMAERNIKMDAMRDNINTVRDEVFLVCYWEEADDLFEDNSPLNSVFRQPGNTDGEESEDADKSEDQNQGMNLVCAPVLVIGNPSSKESDEKYLLLGWEDMRLPLGGAISDNVGGKAKAPPSPNNTDSFQKMITASASSTLNPTQSFSKSQMANNQDALIQEMMTRILDEDPVNKWVSLTDLLQERSRAVLIRLQVRLHLPEYATLVLPTPVSQPADSRPHSAASPAPGHKKGMQNEKIDLPMPATPKFLRVAPSSEDPMSTTVLVVSLWMENGAKDQGIHIKEERHEELAPKKSRGKLSKASLKDKEESKSELKPLESQASTVDPEEPEASEGALLMLQEVTTPLEGMFHTDHATKKAVFARIRIPPRSRVPFKTIQVTLSGPTETGSVGRFSMSSLGSLAELGDESGMNTPRTEGVNLDASQTQSQSQQDVGGQMLRDRIFKVTMRGPVGSVASFFCPAGLEVADAGKIWEGLGGQVLSHQVTNSAIAQGEWRTLFGYSFMVGKSIGSSNHSRSGVMSSQQSRLASRNSRPPSKTETNRTSLASMRQGSKANLNIGGSESKRPSTMTRGGSKANLIGELENADKEFPLSGAGTGGRSSFTESQYHDEDLSYANMLLMLSLLDDPSAPYVRLIVVDNDTGEADSLPTLHSPLLSLCQNSKGYTIFAVAHCHKEALPASSCELLILSKGEQLLMPKPLTFTNSQFFGGLYQPNADYRLFRDVMATSEIPVSVKLWTPLKEACLRLRLLDPSTDEILCERRSKQNAEVLGFRFFRKGSRKSSIYENQNMQIVVEAELDFRKMLVPPEQRSNLPFVFKNEDPEVMKKIRQDYLDNSTKMKKTYLTSREPMGVSEPITEVQTPESSVVGEIKDDMSLKALEELEKDDSAPTTARGSAVGQGLQTEQFQPIPWFLDIVTAGDIIIANDTTRLEYEEKIRAQWEKKEPVRAEKAAKVRDAFFNPPPVPPPSGDDPTNIPDELAHLLDCLPAESEVELRRRRERAQLPKVVPEIIKCKRVNKPRLLSETEKKENLNAQMEILKEAEGFLDSMDKKFQSDIGVSRRQIADMLDAIKELIDQQNKSRRAAMDTRERYVIAKIKEFEKRSEELLGSVEGSRDTLSPKGKSRKK